MTVWSLARAEAMNGNNKKAANREYNMPDTGVGSLGGGVNAVTSQSCSGDRVTTAAKPNEKTQSR